MRLVRYYLNGQILYGVLEGRVIRTLARPPFEGIKETGATVPLEQVRLLAPCVPSKIIALGLNYLDHAAEFGRAVPAEPLIFMKPSTSVVGPEDDIVYPRVARRVDYEAELAVVIGRVCRHVRQEALRDCILGDAAINAAPRR